MLKVLETDLALGKQSNRGRELLCLVWGLACQSSASSGSLRRALRGMSGLQEQPGLQVAAQKKKQRPKAEKGSLLASEGLALLTTSCPAVPVTTETGDRGGARVPGYPSWGSPVWGQQRTRTWDG